MRQLWLLHITFLIRLHNIDGREAFMNGNITELFGSNETELKCTFSKDRGDFMSAVIFLAENSSQFEPIAQFPVFNNTISTLTSFGIYLFGNVRLNSITNSSSEAVIVFHNLNCIHEREYKCRLDVFPNGSYTNGTTEVYSNTSSISVKVMPRKPENITYEPAEYTVITEGDNVTFTCSGDVGRPPGTYLWQLISHKNVKNYTDITTFIERNDGSCSYYGTSNLTIHMTADKNQAIIRCVEISQLTNEDMFRETNPIEVFYKVRKPSLSIIPDKEIYDRTTDNITLICNSSGNPKPTYSWYKNDNIISTESFFVITEVSKNKSGEYLCRVNNSVNGQIYNESELVLITIVDDLVFSSVFVVIAVGAICLLLAISTITVIACTRHRHKSSNISDDLIPFEPHAFRDNYELVSADGTEEKATDNINVNDTTSFKVENNTTEKDSKTGTTAVYSIVMKKGKDNFRIETTNPKTQDDEHDETNVQDDPYELSKDGFYDTAGDRRHKTSQKHKSYDLVRVVSGVKTSIFDAYDNGDSISTPYKGEYSSCVNKGFQNDDTEFQKRPSAYFNVDSITTEEKANKNACSSNTDNIETHMEETESGSDANAQKSSLLRRSKLEVIRDSYENVDCVLKQARQSRIIP